MSDPRGALATAVRDVLGENVAEPLAALDALARRPELGGKAIDALLRALARAKAEETAPIEVALAGLYLARGDAPRARELALAALAEIPASDAPLRARCALRLAEAEAALSGSRAAGAALARAFPDLLELDPDALGSLAALLASSNEALAAQAVERLRRERLAHAGERAGARLDLLGRLLRALGSSLQATAEPLVAILRAVLDETGANRGFIMLYEGSELRFELGLRRDGQVIGPSEFKYSTTIVGSALEEARCVVVPDFASRLPFAVATSANELGIRSALCAPLRTGRKLPGAPDPAPLAAVRGIAGVLYVDATATGSFRESDAPFFETLADAAAVAVRAARTATALRERSAKEARPRAAPRAAPVVLAHPYEEIGTQDEGFRRVLAVVDRVVASDASVLVRGESGTGKELVARAIHRHGRRASGPFVVLDCAAIPGTLVAAELFGHEAGAFTGAHEARAGLFERAHGGTIFLDEAGEMSPELQGALLRVLEEGKVRRVGGTRARAVDVRIVAATHRDLRALVEKGAFRHDLFFRLAVVEVRLPPLRDRRGDVALLAGRFLEGIGRRAGRPAPTIEPAALARLEEHGWPGNVRELANLLEAVALESPDVISLAAVDEALARAPLLTPEPTRPAAGAPDGETLEDLERRAILERLERFGWNQVRAAESLGIDRRTLYRKIRRYGVRPDKS
ncbi:MAG TPA: sigma-54-dependent Fis family transcriptional regulator [Planctomycetota bacterium]|nr:sigma-54-dependent Fis family transcriptional regulator [Planctomycetota bacterium]